MPPSFAHEAPRELCEAFPDLVPCMLRDLLHVDLPPFSGLRLEDSNFTQAFPKEFRADAALVLGSNEPAAGVIFEIQSAIDLLKRFSWPLYLAALHARLRCPCYLLVLALDRRTARWASESIPTFQPGARFRPLVIGPDELPAITDLLQAQANPSLAALSALLHASDPHPEEVIVTAMAAVNHGYGLDRALWLLNVLRPLVDDAILTRLLHR